MYEISIHVTVRMSKQSRFHLVACASYLTSREPSVTQQGEDTVQH